MKGLNKIFYYLLIPSISFGLFSCGEGPSSRIQTDQKTENKENQPQPVTINPNAKFYMTFDVLGGVFRNDTSKVAKMTSDLTISKLSISLPEPPHAEQKPRPKKPFDIDFSNQYVGLDGMGRLTLTALGKGEESTSTRHFSQLALRFFFFDYAFNNPCLGTIYLDGEVDCDVEGDYEMETKNFLGEVHCTNGPKENRSPVLYVTQEVNHEIVFDARLKIDGNPFKYSSYTYEGEIAIDGEGGIIQDMIEKGAVCH